jgi:MarR family transcriptional regulator, organic hydroperoxide resistance regulator
MSHKASAAPARADDFWPLLIEFALSQRGWWVGLCTEFDLSPMQGHALRILDPERPVAMSALADALLCDASNVTGIVDKLESRGLIARQSADHDRRIKMLVVTESGAELRRRLFSRSLEPPTTIAALPAEVRRRLAEVLRAVLVERGEND